MAATVPMLHGQMTMPPVRKEPLAMPAPKVLVMVVVDLPRRRQVRRFPQEVRKLELLEPYLPVRLLRQHLDACRAEGQVDRPARAQQHFEQPQPVRRAARAGHGKDQVSNGHDNPSGRDSSAGHPAD